MLGPRAVQTEMEVGTRADTERNPSPYQFRDQPRVVRGAHAMVDPLRLEHIDGIPDAFGAAGFARMDGPMQARGGSPLKCLGEAWPSSPGDGLIAVNRQADDAWVAAFDHPVHQLKSLGT